jgi:cell division protein FtsQ
MKINKKIIISFVLWIIGLSMLVFSLAFATAKQKNVEIQNLSISVANTDVNDFIDEDGLKRYLQDRQDTIVNTEIKNLDITTIEKVLNAHPDIENADVSVDINGDVNINVLQRTPIVRVFNLDGESYYIDTQSKLMPLSETQTARVLIASGFIFEPYSRRVMTPVNVIAKNEIYSKFSVLDDIYVMADCIRKDSLLNNLVHQIKVLPNKEFELYLAIGNHKILFGEAIDIEEKFKKLKLFYTDGLNKTDGWNKYSIINIKYKNQVVCTKK